MRAASLSVLVLVLLACGGTSKPHASAVPDDDAEGDAAGASNPFLDRIPADTPYFYVSTVSSLEYLDIRLAHPAWREVRLGLERAEQRDPEAFARLDVTEKLGLALLVEIAPGLSRAFENAGLPASARFAIYGLELMPVVRVEIEDAIRFRAAFDRIEARIGAEPAISRRSGYEIRRYQADETIVVAALGDSDVAFAMTSAEDLESTLTALVDPGAVARSLADADTVRRLASRHSLPASYVGAVDLARIAAAMAELLGGGDAVGELRDGASARCLRELSASPMIVAFGGSMAADGVHAKIAIEISPELAARFGSARVPIPGASRAETEGARVALGLGLDLGAALRELRVQMAVLAQRFGGCTEIDGVAKSMAAVIDPLLASPLTQVRGLSLLLREGDLAASPPRVDYALGFVGASDPSSMVALIAALLAIQAPALSPGEPPVRFELPALEQVAFLGLSHDLLGIAIGAGAEVELASKLAEPISEPGALLLLRLDPSLLVAIDDAEIDDYASVAAEDPELAAALRTVEAHDLLRFRDVLFTVELEDEAIAVHVDMLFADR